MLSKEEIEKAREFDDAAAAAGGYLDTTFETPSYRLRDMHRWAKAHGKSVDKMTVAEKDQFLVTPKTKAL